ncbi:MAG: SRPBCC domain-containing protein [Anaerolineales bacterium]|nr:SRPBCC domain-containing protein [Anaerolineales bacterium]
MKENRNEIEIQATAEQVWKVLTDLDKYSEWNPLLYRGVGKVEPGETVEVSAKTATKDMKFICKVTEVEPYHKFAWKFHVIHPLLFRGLHIFQIESVDEHKVRFIDREQFEGLLLPMQAKDLEANGLSAMVAMGEALKKRVA